MPDKMMRISGRGDDGTAKAIKTTNEGHLDVRLGGSGVENPISLIKKAVEDSLTNIRDLYHFGTEHNSFSKSTQIGNSYFTKEKDHLSLNVRDNSSSRSEIELVSDEPILKAGERYKKVIVEYEFIPFTPYNNPIDFHVRDTKLKSEATVGRSSLPIGSKKHVGRRFAEIDISTLDNSNEYYLGVGLIDNSTEVSVDANLKIFSIYVVKEKFEDQKTANYYSIIKKAFEDGLSNRRDLYHFGAEHNSFSQSIQMGNSYFTKEKDHLSLNVRDNPSGRGEIELASDKPILEVGERYEKVVVEYEFIPYTPYNNPIDFHVRDTKLKSEATVGRSSLPIGSKKHVGRRFAEIDISTLNNSKKYYLGVGLIDNATAVSVDANLKIFSIYLITKTPQMLVSVDKDEKTPSILTSVKDDDGRDVLRTVDAAPFAYDELNDLINVKIASNKVKEIMVLNNYELRGSEYYQPPAVDVSNMGGKKMLAVRNSLDVPVEIKVLGPYPVGGSGWAGEPHSLGSINPGGAFNYFTNVDLDLLDLPISQLYVRFTPQGTANSGEITAYISGV